MSNQKHILDINIMNRVINAFYLIMLMFFIFLQFAGWTYMCSIEPFLSIRTALARIEPYLPAVMLSIIILDAYCNRLKGQKALISIIGLILITKLNLSSFNEHLTFLVCYIIAYPSSLNLRKTVYFTLISCCIFSILTIGMFLLGLIQELTFVQHGVRRHSLGFEHPNGLSIILSALVMAWVYLKSASWRLRDVAISLLLLIIIFTIGNGRSALGYGIIQVVLTTLLSTNLLPKKGKQIVSKTIFACATWLFPILAFLSLASLPLIQSVHGTDLYNIINGFLTTRLDGMLNCFHLYGYPLFSAPFEIRTVLDNAFLYITWACGIIALIYIAILYVVGGKSYEKNNDLAMAIYTTLFLLHCFTETIIFHVIINITILAIGAALAGASKDIRPLCWKRRDPRNKSAST